MDLRPVLSPLRLALLFCTFLPAIGCDDGAIAPSPDQSEVAVDVFDGVPVTSFFELEACRAGKDTFYDFPFPSELRTHEGGQPDLTHFPASSSSLVRDAVQIVETERAGFSASTAIYFRFDDVLDVATFPTPAESTGAEASIQLVDITEGAASFGSRIPIYATFREAKSTFWRSNMLAIRGVPGLSMLQGHRYAAVVTRKVRGSNNRPLAPSALFESLKGEASGELASYVGVFAALQAAGVEAADVIVATAFTTSDSPGEMDRLRSYLEAHPVGPVSNWKKEDSPATHDLYSATFTTTEFFSGTSPYTSPFGAGQFEFDGAGAPLNAKSAEVRLAITVPTGAAPAGGFPLVVYGHGTGGDCMTHTGSNDEGAWLASVGLATVGFDAALQGTRVSMPIDVEGLLASNPIAVRESVRQTTLDMMVLYRLLREGSLDVPGAVTGGHTIAFDKGRGFYMGHSQGSQEAGLLLGIEPFIESAFLSAGGGGTMIAILERELNGQPIACIISLVLGIDCENFSAEHPAGTLVIQPLMDPADPLNYASRFMQSPPPGMKPKHIAMSEGTKDVYTPPLSQEALAAAIGLPIVEPVARTSDAIELSGLASVSAPVSRNISTPQGLFTGGLMQWPGEGHFAIYDNSDARRRYIDFFRTALEGTPVLAP